MWNLKFPKKEFIKKFLNAVEKNIKHKNKKEFMGIILLTLRKDIFGKNSSITVIEDFMTNPDLGYLKND